VPARWLIAFGVLIVAGFVAILQATSPSATLVFLPPEARTEHSSPHGVAAAASSKPGESVQVSSLVLDFGSVPILFPSTESFYLVNHGRGPVEVRRVSLDGPFRAETTIAQLDPKVSTKFTVTFDPKKPGTYEQRLRLTLDDGTSAGQEVEVLVRGRGVLSPQAAGIAIPPPPDQALRAYQAQRTAKEIAQYREATETMEQVSLEAAFPKFVGPAAQGGDAMVPVDGGPEGAVPAGRFAPDHVRSFAVASLMAFGEESGQDNNDVPTPITGGETTPELPPGSGDDDDEGDANPPIDDDEEDEEDGSGDNQDDEGEDDQSKSEDDDAGMFIIAPNSSVVVYSNRVALPLQAHPITVTPGSSLMIESRMALPEFMLAFGEFVSLEQWGPISGTLAQDGTVVMNMNLRVQDSGGASITLPLQLTTGMAVGYSAAGRMFFDSGTKRDPVTGNVRMVGIANVPMGQGSAIEKAPVYFELLGRIQL